MKNEPIPKITKQSIHEEFLNDYDTGKGFEALDNFGGNKSIGEISFRWREKIIAFYDTQIQQLLDDIIPYEKIYTNKKMKLTGIEYILPELIDKDFVDGFNQAIQEIKENIKKAGYKI